MRKFWLISVIAVFTFGSYSCKKTYRCTPNTKDTSGVPYWSPDYIDLKFSKDFERTDYEKEENMTCVPL